MAKHTFEITETMTYRLSVEMAESATRQDAANYVREVWNKLTPEEMAPLAVGLIDQDFERV